MPRESKSQKRTVKRVMHEFKHGELRSPAGKIKSRGQAVAIALSEAGESRNKSRAENRRNRARVKSNERRGVPSRMNRTRAELYAEARRRKIPGRSQMNKADLARALAR